MKKLISIILSVVLLFSILAVEASAALDPIYMKDADGNVLDEIDYQATLLQYLNSAHEFKTDEAKLATMTLMYEKDGYQLWADEFTGEVATKISLKLPSPSNNVVRHQLEITQRNTVTRTLITHVMRDAVDSRVLRR